jgi:hypothetical protein
MARMCLILAVLNIEFCHLNVNYYISLSSLFAVLNEIFNRCMLKVGPLIFVSFCMHWLVLHVTSYKKAIGYFLNRCHLPDEQNRISNSLPVHQ